MVLLDSVTALLSNEMFPPYREEIWEADLSAPVRVEENLYLEFAAAVGHDFVSDYIYGIFPATRINGGIPKGVGVH